MNAGSAQPVTEIPAASLNLALVCDAPIRVDAALLDNPETTRHTRWQQFPTSAPDLAAEVRERHAKQHHR
jgi:bifunctional DNase/RNase